MRARLQRSPCGFFAKFLRHRQRAIMHHSAVPAIRLNNAVAGRTSRSRIDAQYSKHSSPRGGFAHRKKCKARNVLVPVVYALLCAPHSVSPASVCPARNVKENLSLRRRPPGFRSRRYRSSRTRAARRHALPMPRSSATFAWPVRRSASHNSAEPWPLPRSAA